MLEFLREFNDLKQQGQFDQAQQLIASSYEDHDDIALLLRSFLLIEQQQYEQATELLAGLTTRDLDMLTEFGVHVARMHLFWNTKQINEMLTPQERSTELLPMFSEEERHQYSHWMAMYYNLTSKLINREGNTNLAEEYLNKGITYYRLAGDPYAIIQSMINLSVIEKDRGNYDKLIKILKDALVQLKQLDSSYRRAKQLEYMILGNIASTYLKKKQFEVALQTYKDSELLVKEIGSEADYCVLLINLGSTSMSLEEYDAASKYLDEALILSRKIKNTFLEAYCQRNLAELEYNLRNFPVALEKLETSLQQARELNLKIVIASNLSNIGLIRALQGHLQEALECYLEVIELIDREGGIFDPDFLDSSYQAIATVYARQGRFDDAEEFWLKQLEICREIDDPGRIASVTFSLFLLSMETKRMRTALDYYHSLEEFPRYSSNRGLAALHQLARAIKLKGVEEDTKAAIALLEDLVVQMDQPSQIFGLTHQVLSIYNLCELYILILREEGRHDYLERTQELAEKLAELARTQHLLVLEGETYILRSKLHVLAYQMDQARRLLLSALDVATTNQLTGLEQEIRDEMATILRGDAFDKTDDLDHMVEQVQILRFLRTKGGSRGSLPDF